MIVQELIEILKSKDQSAEVVVAGHETGYDPVEGAQSVKVVENGDPEAWWSGKYRRSREGAEVVRIK